MWALAVVPNGEGDTEDEDNHGADIIVVSVDPGHSPDFRKWGEWANENEEDDDSNQ